MGPRTDVRGGVVTETPIFDALFVEHTIATLTADYWQAADREEDA